MVEANNTITHDQLALIVRRKSTYYEAMIRAGYEPPALNSALCSLEWMQEARAGHFYCPKTDEVKYHKRCYTPPPKAILIAKLNAILRPKLEAHVGPESIPYLNLLNWMEDHPADTAWLVKLMGIFNEHDEIFAKNYRYVRPKKPTLVLEENNDDGFFND